MKIVLAGTYREFRQWCQDNGLDHRRQVCITPDSTPDKLLGFRYSMSDVVRVGTWSLSRGVGEMAALVRARALPEPEES